MKRKNFVIKCLKEKFPKWGSGTHEECLQMAIENIGEDAINKFIDSNKKDDSVVQDSILYVFQAIHAKMG